jgi:hypothetical protein
MRLSAAASTILVFPDPVGPRKRKLPTGRPGLDIPAKERLIRADDLLDCLILADDPLAQIPVQFLGLEARLRRVKLPTHVAHIPPLSSPIHQAPNIPNVRHPGLILESFARYGPGQSISHSKAEVC